MSIKPKHDSGLTVAGWRPTDLRRYGPSTALRALTSLHGFSSEAFPEFAWNENPSAGFLRGSFR
jgi:hypothetical protein